MQTKSTVSLRSLRFRLFALKKKYAFPLTCDYIDQNMNSESSIVNRTLKSMKMNLRELKTQLLEYFPKSNNDFVAVTKLPVTIHISN